MVQSESHRIKRSLISQWLCDAYGEMNYVSMLANDLIKFLKANGCDMVVDKETYFNGE